jgi:hypothetical protein
MPPWSSKSSASQEPSQSNQSNSEPLVCQMLIRERSDRLGFAQCAIGGPRLALVSRAINVPLRPRGGKTAEAPRQEGICFLHLAHAYHFSFRDFLLDRFDFTCLVINPAAQFF